MLKRILGWLDYEWWGLAVAYALLLGFSYGLIWWLIEPLSLPDEFQLLPNLLKKRWFHHLLLAVLIAAHGIIVIELWRRGRRKTGEQLAYENRRLKRIIREIGRSHKLAYKYVSDTIDREIEEDGTDVRTRTMSVAATADTISWIEIGYGTTVADPMAQGVEYGQPQITDETGRPLTYEIYEDGTDKRALILLPAPLRVGAAPKTIRINRLRTLRAWVELIETLQDSSEYQARNNVDSLVLRIGLPHSLRVETLDVDPPVGNVTRAADGMSVTWSTTGLKVGAVCRYTLRCLRATQK